jgi:hypothetical protein
MVIPSAGVRSFAPITFRDLHKQGGKLSRPTISGPFWICVQPGSGTSNYLLFYSKTRVYRGNGASAGPVDRDSLTAGQDRVSPARGTGARAHDGHDCWRDDEEENAFCHARLSPSRLSRMTEARSLSQRESGTSPEKISTTYGPR